MDRTYWNGFFLPLVFYDRETLVNPPGLWVFLVLFDLCIDDHGSLIIFRSASVRPKHLFDPYFDHDSLLATSPCHRARLMLPTGLLSGVACSVTVGEPLQIHPPRGTMCSEIRFISWRTVRWLNTALQGSR